jgi:hypothetical protein
MVGNMPEISAEEAAALQDLFTYHAPTGEQIEQMAWIREKAREFASLIFAYCPRSADRTAALRKVREAVMTANASIVLNGRNL